MPGAVQCETRESEKEREGRERDSRVRALGRAGAVCVLLAERGETTLIGIGVRASTICTPPRGCLGTVKGCWWEGAGCRVQGAGCRVQGVEYRVEGVRWRV